jgi:hypothetical protein
MMMPFFMKYEVVLFPENSMKNEEAPAHGHATGLPILKAGMIALSMHLFRIVHLTKYKYSGHLPENQDGKHIQSPEPSRLRVNRVFT